MKSHILSASLSVGPHGAFVRLEGEGRLRLPSLSPAELERLRQAGARVELLWWEGEPTFVVVEVSAAASGEVAWALSSLPPLEPRSAAALTLARRELARVRGRRLVCAIVGAKESSPRFTPEARARSVEAGRIAARAGLVVLTGGLSGVMSAAAQGAQEERGTAVGILPGDDPSAANRFIEVVLPSGIGYARNYLTALGCDLMIALPGGNGTLEEMLFALDFGRLVLSWGSHSHAGVEEIDPADPGVLARRVDAFVMMRQWESLAVR